MSETKRAGWKRQADYDKTHTRVVHMKLNLRTDADILAMLDEQESMQGYIKQLIRDDIRRRHAAALGTAED